MSTGSFDMHASSALWIPLMDYAMKKGVSLSTLRRHIKANKINYKIENGRYLLPDDGGELGVLSEAPITFSSTKAAPLASADSEQTIQKLKQELQKAHEEIVELKTLIAFYEERAPQNSLDV